VMFVAQSLNDIVETYGANNTILDNLHIYTAFSALDPLTQDKVSKLTGSVLETRTSRSSPAALAAGRSSVSRSQIERPLLEPGEIRALPDDIQLVFAAGARPLRTTKLLYDVREPFRTRARDHAPDQEERLDAPPGAPHPWAGRRSLGEDAEASLPLFKEVAAAMDDKKVAARVADIYGRVAQEMETLKSWNTGHPGGLSTLHANSADDVLRRMEDLIAEVSSRTPRRAIAQAVDRIVHIRRTAAGRQVQAVLGVEPSGDDGYAITSLA
jgi:hypothetical protein